MTSYQTQAVPYLRYRPWQILRFLALCVIYLLLVSHVFAQEDRRGGTLNVGITEAPTDFNPWDLGPPFGVTGFFYNVLARYDANMEPQPELAESWTFNESGTAITLQLREGVKFHSGQEMTADDVIFSLNTALSPDVYANLQPLAEAITGAVAVDRYTVQFEFAHPNPAVFDLLDLLFIVNQEGWDDVRSAPAGTGPFRLVDHIPGNRLVLERFEDYWREGYPLLDRVNVQVVSDPQALALNLETGGLDLIVNFPARDLDRLTQNPTIYGGFTAEGSTVISVVINTTWGPMQDPQVRRALNLAINRPRFTRVVLQGTSIPKCLPWSESSIAYQPQLEVECEYNPERAQELLAEAGYPNGFDLVIMTSTQRSSDWTRFAEMLQSDLANIGIRATIEDLESAAYVQKRRVNDFQISVHNFGRANKDPASLFGTAANWKPEDNPSLYVNEEYTRLVEEAATTMDPQRRLKLYHRLNRIILDDLFVLNVADRPRAWAALTSAQDIQWSLDGMLIVDDTWLDR
jgi:peptide/nickel transport system substrate-binding protein